MAYRRTPSVEARLGRTRDTIVRSARRHVAASGLDGWSVVEVAATADVSVGTVYRHFPTKHELLRVIVDDICDHELAIVAKVAVEPVGPSERLQAAVVCFAERALASGRVAYAVIAEPAPAEVEAVRLGHRRALADIFAAVVADGIDTGDFPPQTPLVTATAIVGAVSEVLVGPLAPAEGGDATAVLDDVVTFVRRAVIGDTSAPPPGGTT